MRENEIKGIPTFIYIYIVLSFSETLMILDGATLFPFSLFSQVGIVLPNNYHHPKHIHAIIYVHNKIIAYRQRGRGYSSDLRHEWQCNSWGWGPHRRSKGLFEGPSRLLHHHYYYYYYSSGYWCCCCCCCWYCFLLSVSLLHPSIISQLPPIDSNAKQIEIYYSLACD